MHKRCREIMDELILSGELEEINWFEFAPKEELKLRLKDMLDDEVNEKYLLSDKLVSYFEKHKEEQNKKRNGFGWHPLDKNSEVSFTITNPGKTRPNETYIKLQQTHTLNIKGNDSIKRIYSSDGHNPSLTTMQGGHREPKVAINVVGQYNKPFQKRINETPVEINQFLKDNKNNLSLKQIAEKTNIPKTQIEHYYRTDKSRAIPSKEDWKKLKEVLIFDDTFDKLVCETENAISTFESSSRVYGTDGLAPCITSVNADKYIIDKIAHPVREVGRRLDVDGKRCDDNKDIPITRRYEIRSKEISNFLSRVQKDSYVATKENIDSKYIFRKLTPRECFRLQGFDDSFIFPSKMSDSQLYKQAGNGMSRNILDMIFTQIFTCYTKHIEKQNSYARGGYTENAEKYIGKIV